MTKRNDIYKCDVCGNIVEVLMAGGGELVCCGQSMKHLEEMTEDAGLEKHVPIIEQANGKVTVKVGSVEHPMEEQHFIQFIEVLADDKVYRKFLHSNEKPEAVFEIEAKNIVAREFCNLHGLWRST